MFTVQTDNVGGFEMKLLVIEWVDSQGITSSWEHKDEIKPLKVNKCQSVGFLLEETEDYKTLCPNISETQVLGRISIPKCAILKVTEIEALK
jgi:hypothetical protein